MWFYNIIMNSHTFCLIGHDISKSFSPLLHNSLFKKKQKLYSYGIRECESAPTLENLRKETELKGISITIPFKEAYK